MSTYRPHRHRTAAAALAVVLAVAFVGTNLAAYFHVATERHETCDEHGEVYHPATAAIDRDRAPTEAALFGAGDTSDPGPEHGHCQLVPSCQPKLEVASAPAILAAPDTACARVELPPQRAPSDAGLYELAPKTSPPV